MKDFERVEFIKNPGYSLVSKNIVSGKGKLKWMIREEPKNNIDNGWIFLSHIDDDDFCNDPENYQIMNFNDIAAIDPIVLGVFLQPVGSDLQVVVEGDITKVYDNITGKPIDLVFPHDPK